MIYKLSRNHYLALLSESENQYKSLVQTANMTGAYPREDKKVVKKINQGYGLKQKINGVKIK